MKRICFYFVALLFVACTDEQYLSEAVVEHAAESNLNSEFDTYLEKARWGDADAYIKLADCYRDGVGVEPDFMNMLCMLAMADEYGKCISEADYVKQLPSGHEFRMLFDAVDLVYKAEYEKANQIADEMIARNMADGYSAKGISLTEQGDTLNGKTHIQTAAEKGSTLASLLIAARLNWKNLENADVDRLIELSEKLPTANYLLVNLCFEKSGNGMMDNAQIAHYLVKADKKGMLSRRAAGWLLGYYDIGAIIQLTDKDVERLRVLSGAYPVEETAETVCHADKELEIAVEQILKESSSDWECNNASAYVVETQTGRIKAQIGLERRGYYFAPYEDAFADEQMVMMTAPTYLALLTTGKVTPETMFDTGAGIYKDVRDHNWRRGGYGNICLERALECHSRIAFTMAKEQVYGSCTEAFDRELNGYFYGMNDTPFGMLTFYNAIANNGRMVLPISEGEEVVLDEQIAPSEHIKTLQDGLRKCVSQGLMRKCSRDYVDVAACGRTFIKGGLTYRLELCGYFPAQNPQYTIMVILEKDGLPASAGGMCGPIMTKMIDYIVDNSVQ